MNLESPNNRKANSLTPNRLTPLLNEQNIESVKKMIEMKKGVRPFYATTENTLSVLTDMDHFPYNRYFRGVAHFPEPVVMEREAGWRPLQPSCYGINKPPETQPYPQHCFQMPCSTVYPCYPQYMQKYSDKEFLDLTLNKACIVQYR